MEMEGKELRILVAHPAQQHSYRLATALNKHGMLNAYVTTVYLKPGSLTSFVAHILPPRFRAKAEGRRCSELRDASVIQYCEIGGLLKLFCLNVPIASKWYTKVKYRVADQFAGKVAKLAVREHVDAVITYDDTSPVLFELLKQNAPNIKRIVDMSAANTLYMREIYERDFLLKPDFAEKLKRERELVWNSELSLRMEREIEAAEYFLCGSKFVVKSLGFSDVAPERCRICPYGVDTQKFKYVRRPVTREDDALEFVFVGGTKELKGISYLLDAFLKIPAEQAKLTIVGANTLSEELQERYLGRVSFTGMLPHDEVPLLLEKMDVMIFPSLGEGFSLAFMEALSAGLPVIGSCNAGANDVLNEGENGFTIPIQDERAIIDAVNWFVANRSRIPEMSLKARETAEEYTWDAYYERVVQAIRGICNE